MLTRIWERLPFGEGQARRAYMDSAPLPYSLDKSVPGAESQPSGTEAKPKVEGITAEGALARIRAERDALAQRLQRLETMLADPEKGQNAILYYRLRAVWNLCNRDLMALSRQFHDKYVASAGEQSAAAGATPAEAANDAHAARLRAAQARIRALQEETKKLDFNLNRREKPFKVGEKQSLNQALEKAQKALETAIREMKVLKNQRPQQDKVPVENAAQTQGNSAMTVQTKRAINTTLIALAQHFYLAYREEQIAEMALRASRKGVDEVNFGLSGECLTLANKIRELATLSKNESNRHEVVRKRVEYLKDKLRYASAGDAIPDPHSLNSIPTRVASKEGLFANLGDEIPVNVLALNYWDLKQALLR